MTTIYSMYILWINMGYDGWSRHGEYKTIKEAINARADLSCSGEWEIGIKIDYDIIEK